MHGKVAGAAAPPASWRERDGGALPQGDIQTTRSNAAATGLQRLIAAGRSHGGSFHQERNLASVPE